MKGHTNFKSISLKDPHIFSIWAIFVFFNNAVKKQISSKYAIAQEFGETLVEPKGKSTN